MEKFYLLMIICIYNPIMSLENTCKIVPMSEPFETLNECLDMGKAFKTKLQLEMVNVYPASFCSEKNFTST
jgi:hypothetical protein